MKIIGYFVFIIILCSGCAVFKFSRTNHPPEIPNELSPQNDLPDVEVNSLKLSWECSDIDNDKLTYKIYLSEDTVFDSTNIISPDFSEKYFTINELEFEKDYYWFVTADDGEFISISKIMHFNTKSLFPVPLC